METAAERLLAPSLLEMARKKLEYDVGVFVRAPLAKKRLRSIQAVLELLSSEPLEPEVAHRLCRFLVCLRRKSSDPEMRSAFRQAIRQVNLLRKSRRASVST